MKKNEPELAKVATELINFYDVSENEFNQLLDVMHLYMYKKGMFQYQFNALIGDLLNIVNTKVKAPKKKDSNMKRQKNLGKKKISND